MPLSFDEAVGALQALCQERIPPAQLLKAVVESSHNAILSKSIDGIITSWNPAAERLFGYTAKEILGKPLTILFPDDRKNEEEEVLKRTNKGETVDVLKTVRITKSGERIPVSIIVSPIYSVGGKIIGSSAIVQKCDWCRD